MIDNVLSSARSRNCFWAPDYNWLSMLKPLAGRALTIGPRIQLSFADASNQTLAASTSIQQQFSIVALGGQFPPIGTNQVLLYESIYWRLTATDASGKLQIVMAMVGDSFQVYPANTLMPLPYTMPSLNNAFLTFTCTAPVPLHFGPSATGPTAWLTIVNTDGAASHTYTRRIGFSMRVIENVDVTAGPTIPGTGMSL